MNIPQTDDLQHAANVIGDVIINQFWKEKMLAVLRRVGNEHYFNEKKKKRVKHNY